MPTSECQKRATKVWYEKNCENFYSVWNEPFECECGGRFTRRNNATHIKTQLHRDFLFEKLVKRLNGLKK